MILPSFQIGQLTTPAANTSFINKYKFFKDACVSLSFWYSQVLSFDWSWFQWSSAGVDAHYAIIRRNCLSLPFYYTEKYSVCKKKACHCFVQCIHTIKPGQCTIFCSLSTMIWATSWENLFMPYANNKGADQPAHWCSLISAFVVRFPGSIIPLLAKSKISRFQLASIAEHAGLSLPWSQTPKTDFLVTGLILSGLHQTYKIAFVPTTNSDQSAHPRSRLAFAWCSMGSRRPKS